MNRALIKSVVQLTCPKCRKAPLFEKRGWFIYRRMLNMHTNCSNCQLKYEIEPGFWTGALWASYPIVLLVEIPFLMMALFSALTSPWAIVGIMIAAFLICWPVFLRLGRSIWIHAWMKYDPTL
jgi:uncharacterized protein (DUF983 family)